MQIDIIAPGFQIPQKDYQKTLKMLKGLSVEPHIREPLFEEGYLCAASQEKRWKDLKSALTYKKPSIIWCLRGGYGCLHLLPQLQKFKKPQVDPKLLIGFSDITILHYYLNQVWKWPSLHYQHLNSYVLKEEVDQACRSLKKDLKTLSKTSTYLHKNLKPVNKAALRTTEIKGPIVGGNLITLASLIGSGLPLPKNQFLFLEEIEEPAYKVDRALNHLKQSGWLKKLKGVLLGSFTHTKSKQEKMVSEQIEAFFQNSSLPVFKGLRCGHIQGQKPLFFSTPSRVYRQSSKFILENSGLIIDPIINPIKSKPLKKGGGKNA